MTATLRLLSVGTLAILALAGCDDRTDKAAAPVIRPVLSMVVHPVTDELVGPYAGDIEARYKTTLSFQTSGRIISRSVHVGDLVTKGQLLASLDAKTDEAQLASAQADVAAAQATYHNLALVEERAKALLQTAAAPQAQLDSAISARKTAQAQLNQAQANLAKSENELTFTAIKATFDGVVTSTDAEVGQVVSAGQSVVTVARPDVREAVLELPEALASLAVPGTPWGVTVVGVPDEKTTGIVREVSPLINASTRTQTVRLSLTDPPQAFRLGATVDVSHERSVPSEYLLPTSAILKRDGRMLVWTVDPKSLKVSLRVVGLGATTDRSVAVTSGLRDGDRVVIVGVHSLDEGQLVELGSEGPNAL